MNFIPQPTDNGLLNLKLTGRIANGSIDGAADRLVQLCGPDVYSRRLLIDLSDVDFIDSTGVGCFLIYQNRFKTAGGMVVFHSANPLASYLMKTMRMELALKLAPTPQDARQLALQEKQS